MSEQCSRPPLDQPGDVRLWEMSAQGFQDGAGKDHIADGTQPDDQDASWGDAGEQILFAADSHHAGCHHTGYDGSRIAILAASYGDGGVERMLVHTANGLAALGIGVDFLLGARNRPFVDDLHQDVRLIQLPNEGHKARLKALGTHLHSTAPAIVLSAKLPDDRLALAALEASGAPSRVVFRVGNPLFARNRLRSAWFWPRWRRKMAIKRLYRRAHGIIAVAPALACELRCELGHAVPIITLPNPTIGPALADWRPGTPPHPWLAQRHIPVILGVGGLRQQKDFVTLLRAFALLRREQVARLIILGEGRQRHRLETLAQHLGVADDVLLPGFASPLYDWMGHAALFVLSSRWEGSPNALIEALALGCPVVATTCPGGVADILYHGRLAPLVPVGDAVAMAQAMATALQQPGEANLRKQAAARFTASRSAVAYARALGLAPTATPS